ncbi:MAG: CvpA family protein [Clostridia bacterium]|nr:CvpA family protein [Clostridia bacterium]MBQ2940975.1 CvpA family protein [Clostridia bacterium]
MGEMIVTLADVILLILLGLFALWGWKKGLVKMGFGLLSFLAAIFMAKMLYPYCATFLRNTAVYEKLLSLAEKQTPPAAVEGGEGVIGDILAKGGDAISGALSGYIAELAINILAFVLVLILVKLLLMLFSRLLKLFTSLPVIGLVNRFAGLAFGILEGILVVTVLLAAIYVVAPLRENPTLSHQIEKSVITRQWYLENPLVEWAFPEGGNQERK